MTTNVELVLSDKDRAYIAKNLYSLYLHDLSEFEDVVPNEHGILEPELVRTLADQGEVQNVWWEKSEVLFPFLICVDGVPAGFNFIATGEYVPTEADYLVHEFFLVHAFRGKGVGEKAAIQGFEKFTGRWEFYVAPNNLPALAFWRKTLCQAFGEEFEENRGETFLGDRVIFRFDNS